MTLSERHLSNFDSLTEIVFILGYLFIVLAGKITWKTNIMQTITVFETVSQMKRI